MKFNDSWMYKRNENVHETTNAKNFLARNENFWKLIFLSNWLPNRASSYCETHTGFDVVAISLRVRVYATRGSLVETKSRRRASRSAVNENWHVRNFQSRAAVRWTPVLRSRRGWGGGRAHGRAPPLPNGTYISWLAAGVTRTYNTIASASSAARHASSREYSTLVHRCFRLCQCFVIYRQRRYDCRRDCHRSSVLFFVYH